ncbi:acyltransferase family protein [Ferrimonas balearica]|uniref:acyltransferase family protein n=1 Tax=Ferrimonas balearica TaxID=44012 RepID=UPI001C9884CC|nr:acyltransferase family protein [Ferrimonas balearica]MBY5980819.1 acyltransferase [Ferrimonas balearica]
MRHTHPIRADINGLRAVAVLVVVIFHFDPAWMPGGFAGVDVFFVISGFLMTGIIFRGLEQGNFSLWAFYRARARRIVPALVLVCAFLALFGYLYLPPFDYRTLLDHIAASLLFVSNIVYWRESGYFDLGAHDKWLLHTWSLSVEWQFYLIYPLVLLGLARLMGLLSLKRLVLLATVVGFLFNVYAAKRWPDPTYFLLPTRAWEMLAGGVVYLYPLTISPRWQKTLEWMGLTLIILTCFWVSASTPWPGALALGPVLGTALILVANRQDSIATNNRLFQWIGTWSYSIYLWHWVVVVMLYQMAKLEPGVYQALPLFYLASVLLGWLSYRYIECSRMGRVWATTYGAVLIVALVWMVNMPKDAGAYLPESVASSMQVKPYECFDRAVKSDEEQAVCSLGSGRGERVLALGDSHMFSILPALESMARRHNVVLEYAGYSGCPPILTVHTERSDQHKKNCKALNDRTLAYAIEQKVDTVFLAARWTLYTDGDYLGKDVQFLKMSAQETGSQQRSIEVFRYGIDKTLSAFREAGIRVVLMLQAPLQNDIPPRLYYQALEGEDVDADKLAQASVDHSKSKQLQAFTNAIIRNASEGHTDVVIIDPSQRLCQQGKCLVGSTERSYYFDDDHLSTDGAALLQPMIEQALVTPLRRSALAR